VSSRTLRSVGLAGVDDQLSVDGVADLALQRPQRFLLRLALVDLAIEVGATCRMGLAELTDRGHVEGMVQLAVAALRQPVNGATTGGELDRGRAVVGGVAIPVGESGDVAGVADQPSSDDRSDSEQIGHGRCRCGDSHTDPTMRDLQLPVEASDVVQ